MLWRTMQAALQGVFVLLSVQNLKWLDDILLHAQTAADLIKRLRVFFTICRECNLKLHPGKCTLFSVELRWCGRILSKDGARFDPRRVQGLLDMASPSTGADIKQF
jgi:hypothetical protein